VSTRRFAAVAITVAIAGLLASMFVGMLGPSVERERLAACNGLVPNPIGDALATAAYPTLPMPAPDFVAQDYTGAMRRLSEFRGKVVFLNFWATWCPPCKEEVPSIQELQAALGNDDFVVLAVASSREWQSIFDHFPGGTNMTILLDPPATDEEQIGKITRGYGVPALPETFVIDKQGFIRYYFVNKRDWSQEVALTCLRSLTEEEDSLSWLKSWLWTMNRTS
jgi:thiol-disulfide isomerase/thioredoxin